MIHIIAKVGSGDRKASIIDDALIPDETTAFIRAQQELARSTYIVMSRTITFPHEPAGEHAAPTDYLEYQPLGIAGRHIVVSRSISLSPTESRDSVSLEQYRRMIL